MSVYSGFATRQQETFYNKLLEKVIQLLAVKLLSSLKRIDELTSKSPINIVNLSGGEVMNEERPPQAPVLNESKAEFGSAVVGVSEAYKSVERFGGESGPVSQGLTTNVQQSPENPQRRASLIGLESDRKWLQHIRKLYNAIHSMDKKKYLDPKYSMSLYPVIKYLHKRFGAVAGSTLSNISILSQSQRGGGPPGVLPVGLNANFNDSLSSLISADTQIKKTSEISGEGVHPSRTEKTNSSLDNEMVGILNNTYSVVEQSKEDDEDDSPAKVATYQHKNSIITHQERSQSEGLGLPGYKSRNHDTSPSSTIIEPVLKSKQTSRTGAGYDPLQQYPLDFIMAEGYEKYLLREMRPRKITIYQDNPKNNRSESKGRQRNLILYKKKQQIRAHNNANNNHSENNWRNNWTSKDSNMTLESAYKTSYSQVAGGPNGRNQNWNLNTHQSASAYGQFYIGSKGGGQQLRKGQKFIRNIIERTNGLQNTSKKQQMTRDLNRDMHHVDSSKALQPSQQNVSLDTTNSDYIQQHTSESQCHPEQMDRTESSRQYSALSVKRVSVLNQQQSNNVIQEGAKSEIAGGGGGGSSSLEANTSFMQTRQKRKTVANQGQTDKKINSSSLKSGHREQQISRQQPSHPDTYTISSLAFENAYSANPKISLQVIGGKEDGDSSLSSQRSLQKNYLQNLNELVKIHNEMRQNKSSQGQQRRRRQ